MGAQTTVLIQPAELKKLAALEPWRSMAALALDWAVIAGAITISSYSGSWLIYLIAVAVIAGRMHALGVLMHEAAHYRLLPNRKWNERIGDIFAAWPIMATVDGYRQNHLAHHQNANTPDDPDWIVKVGTAAFTFPQRAWRMAKHLAGYLIALQSLQDLRVALRRISKTDRSTGRYKIVRVLFYCSALFLIALFGGVPGFVLYWIVPYFTLLFLFLYVRSVAEHFGATMDYEQELGSTRTVKPYFWERWFFAPHNIHYHLEHHLYPGVPFYNLPKLHEALMRNAYYRENAHITRGYSTGLVRECLA